MDAIVDVDIRRARRTEHRGIGAGFPTECMARGIVRRVGLGFDDPDANQVSVLESPDQHRAQQFPGDNGGQAQEERGFQRFQRSLAWYHRNAMQGVVVIDKPAGWTSQDVVAKAKGIFRTKRAGHAGTLDPDATGVLVVALGTATRLLPWLDLEPKEYVATAAFGISTTTEDASGAVVESADASSLCGSALRAVLPRFTGEIDQVPPMVSALHHQGKRLHELARAGVVVERAPRTVHIHELEMESFEPGNPAEAVLRVVCGGGTYVRTLCADLAGAVGLPGHMKVLRRTRVGAFRIEQAVSIVDARPEHVLPVESVLGHLPSCTVDDDSAGRILRGMDADAPADWADQEVVSVLREGRLLSLAAGVGGKLVPFRVFPPEGGH